MVEKIKIREHAQANGKSVNICIAGAINKTIVIWAVIVLEILSGWGNNGFGGFSGNVGEGQGGADTRAATESGEEFEAA